MGFSLKKLLEGATRQVNIFDNGKTWKNPQGNQSRPSPAQTPPPQSGNMNFAGSKTYGTFNRPSPVVNAAQKQIAQTPKIDTKTKYAQVNAPSYGSGLSGLLNRARDVVDANTAQDRFKRTQIGQPEVVKPMQQQISERAKPIAQGFVEQYNQLGTGVGTLLAQNSKDVKNAQKAQQDLANQLHQQRMATIKLAKAPGVTQPQLNRLNNLYNDLNQKDVELQQQRTNQSNDLYSKLDPKKNLAALASVGFDIATLGYGTAGYQGVKQAGKQGFKAGAKELAKQAGITGSMGAVSGGLSPVVQKGDQATAGDIAKGAATGFAFGAALPVATYGVGSGISKVKDPIQNALKNTGKALGDVRIPNPLPKTQGGFVDPEAIKNSFKGKAPKTEGVPKLTEEQYLSQNGAHFMDGAEPALHRQPNKAVNAQKRDVKRTLSAMDENNAKRAELRKEYQAKLEKGEIAEPTRNEILIEKANGLPELESTQAAQRLLTKQGIDWKTPVKTEGVAPKPPKTDPLESLKAEARKYKSAEEFVKSQPLSYHGTDQNLKKFNNKQGTWFTDDYFNADGYANGVNVYEGRLNLNNPLIIDGKGKKWDELNTKYGKSTQEIVSSVDKTKHDGVIFKNIKDNWIDDADAQDPGTVTYAFDPTKSFLNESQLTDLYNQSQPTPKTEGVAPTGKTERLYHGTNKDFKQFGIDDTTREVRKARQQLLDERNKLVDTGKVENGALSIPKKAQDRINAIDKEVATLDSRTDILPASVKEKGVYFTTDKKYAKTFAGKDGKIVEADVELNNPYIIKSKDEMDLIEDAAYYPKIIDDLEKQGYDGIKAPDGQVLVFDPQKAKLATPTPPKTVAPKTPPIEKTPPSNVANKYLPNQLKTDVPPTKTTKYTSGSKELADTLNTDLSGKNVVITTDAGNVSGKVVKNYPSRITTSEQTWSIGGKTQTETLHHNNNSSIILELPDGSRTAIKGRMVNGLEVQSAPIEKTVEQTPFGPVSKVKKSGTPDQSPELEMQKTPQTQPNLSQATGKVDDLATGTEVSRAGKSGATAQNQTNLEPGNTYTSNKQQRGFKSNIAKDTETPLSVYKDIPGYNVKPNAKTIGSAAQRVAKDPEGTYNRLLENGIQKTDDSADALVLLRNLVENDELDKAGKLAKATAKAGTDFGQAVQIFSAFRKTTPDGALRDAWNIVNAYNAKNPKKTPIRITPEQTKKITDLANDLQNTEYGTREWAKKAALLEREKGLLTPNSFLSKVSTVQTMAQLLNPKTAIRNILGNGVLDLAEDLVRIPAAGIDKALKGLGLIDERNMVLPNMKTNWANKLLGFKQGVEDVNLGIRTTGAAGNYDLTKEVFKPGSAGNKLEKLLGYELSSMDKAFFTGRYQSSLENMMKAQKAKVPTPEMKTTAEAEALYATFQNNSNLSKALQKGKNAANFGKEWGLGDFILKYPKTPGNIVNVGLDYSPVGFVKGLKSLNDGIKLKNIQNIRNGELLLGRSLVGSGLIAGGAFLAKQGIISGKQDGDFDKSAADRDLGKGPFSFNITALERLLKGEDTKARPGDITANYDWLQPNAIQLSMGANMVINSNSATQQINTNLESLGAGIDTISEQPVFRGVKDFVGDLNPQQGGGVGKAMQNVATNAFSSFVPSVVNQVGQQFDNTKRSSYSDTPVGEAINKTKGRIPGARNTLYPSLNTLGEEQKQYDVGGNNPFNVFFNPAFLNRVKDSPALSMADELNQKTGETSQYPRSLTGKQTIDGTKTKLTPEQLFNLKKDVGQTTNSIFQQYANSPIYQNLSDTEKVNTLTNALTDINAAGKATLAAKNSLGQYAPGFTGKPTKLSSSQKALISGEYNVDTKMAGTSIPKGLNQDAVKIIASYNKDNAKGLANNQAVTSALTSWNGGRQIPQVTNEVAKQWADYEKGLKDGSLTKLEAKDQKIKILRNAFNSQLNDDEKQLYKLSKTKITSALSEGLITEDNLKKALAVERQMFDNGLLESETLAKKLGLGSRSKSSGSSSRKSSGRKSSRVKSTKVKTTKTPVSFTKVKNRQKSVNSSLRKLLGSAKV